MQSGNHSVAQKQLIERAKKEEEKLKQQKQEQQKQHQNEIAPLYAALFASLTGVKKDLQCTFNPHDCKFYETLFHDSKLIANFTSYREKAVAFGLDVTELDNAIKNMKELCEPLTLSIPELHTYIQHHIIDHVWNFQYHQIEHPTNRLAGQAGEQQDDVKALHPLLFNQSGLEDINICSENMSSNLSLKSYGLFASVAVGTEGATAFLRLLSSAVDAEPESYNPKSYKPGDETKLAALAILKRHPELLFKKGMVVDHFGRKIWASAYQLLLGAGDIWALKQVHEEIIPMIPDGEEIAQTQSQEQFPHCQQPFDPNKGEEQLYDDRNKAQIAQTIAQLQVIIGKITADPCTNGLATLEETKKAVAELCQIFVPKEGEVIRTGLHFPLAIMKEIFKVYEAQFNPLSAEKLYFFSREVIGAALAASTAVDGQCCKMGLSNLNMKTGPDRQDGLFCSHPKGIPAGLAPIRTKLGREMFVDPYDGYSCFLTSSPGVFDWYHKNGACGGGCGWGGAGVEEGRAALGKFMSSKNFTLAELMQPKPRNQSQPCVMF